MAGISGCQVARDGPARSRAGTVTRGEGGVPVFMKRQQGLWHCLPLSILVLRFSARVRAMNLWYFPAAFSCFALSCYPPRARWPTRLGGVARLGLIRCACRPWSREMKGWLIVGKVLPWLCGVCLGLLPVLYGLGFWHWQAGLESAAAPKIESRAVALEKPFDPSAVVLLFGDPPTQPALVAPIESVKDSGLSLKLIASFVSPQGRSAAVLAGDAREQQLFFIGDQVLPGVELRSEE